MSLKALIELDFDDFDRMLRTHRAQHGRRLPSSPPPRPRRGAIVNVSTTVIKLASQTYSAYAATNGQ